MMLDDLRSGLSVWLLGKALDLAPRREKASLARAVQDHIVRVMHEDRMPHAIPPSTA